MHFEPAFGLVFFYKMVSLMVNFLVLLKAQLIKSATRALGWMVMKRIALSVARWLLPTIVDKLMDLAREYMNDPTTDADDRWYDQTATFLKAIGDKKLG